MTSDPEGNTKAERNNSAFYIGALIVSVVGATLLMAADFGWWYDYNGYLGYEEWGYVALFSDNAPWSFPLLGHMALGLLFCAYVCFRGLRGASEMSRGLVKAMFCVALYVTVLSLVGGIVFAVAASDNSEWGLDAGFYGGLIGGGLTALFAGMVLRQSDV